MLDGLKLGRAYATEHVLPASLMERLRGHEVVANVTGIGFDGRQLATASAALQL